MATETTQLLNGGNNCSADECCDGTTKPRGRVARVKDMAAGAFLAALVAVLIVNHMQPHFGGSFPQQPAQPVWNNPADDDDDNVHEKSNLRPPKTVQEIIKDDLVASKYEKFQPFGFQIYTGGASALIPVPDSTDDDHPHPKLMNNPECEGRLNTLGHFDEDPENVSLPILFWQCYLGLDDEVEDALRRLDIMIDAVERAYELADQDSKTLKVFNAPEFFFRGKRGAYVYDYEEGTLDRGESCGAVCQLLRGFEKFVAQEKYQDWLFLFGTIIVAEGPLPRDYVSDEWQQGDYLLYNFAPVYKGYDPKITDHNGKRYLVPKRFISQFDFLTTPALYNGSIAEELKAMHQSKVQEIGDERSEYDNDDTELFIPVADNSNDKYPLLENPAMLASWQLFYDQDMWKKYDDELAGLGYIQLKHHWLILDNITFSIEICLDHLHPSAVALRTAQVDDVKGSPLRIPKNVENWNSATNKYEGGVEYVQIPRHKAQLSLVSSMGMEADHEAMALADGGTLILQDGEHPGSGSLSFERGCDGFKAPKFSGGSQVITRSSSFGETSYEYYKYNVSSPVESALVYHKDASFRKAADGVFTTATFKPTVFVYPSANLAKVTVA